MFRKLMAGVVAVAGIAGGFAIAATGAGLATTEAGLATAVVRSLGAGEAASYDAVVEAVRQTIVSAQVAGTVVALEVKAGDVVRAGQVLARIDSRAAEQNVVASDAQVRAARATLEVATREFERARQLFTQNYISRAALDSAEAKFKATEAQVSTQLAQAGVARTESGFYTVRAPYGGVVADVPVTQGDMAMPGRALMTIYDPSAMRVTAAVPQTDIPRLARTRPAKIQFVGQPADREWVVPGATTLLPTLDAKTHTAQIRLDLPAAVKMTPGTFARVWLPLEGSATPRLYVPAAAVVRRAEMTGLYVIGPDGRPLLRQVRLGRAVDDNVEILSGVAAGERVAIDPQAASRAR